jgi:hypothetical protein
MTGDVASGPMSVADFLVWAGDRPDGERWELIEGRPLPVRGPSPAHAMAAESVATRG